jgi:hypothetical protein
MFRPLVLAPAAALAREAELHDLLLPLCLLSEIQCCRGVAFGNNPFVLHENTCNNNNTRTWRTQSSPSPPTSLRCSSGYARHVFKSTVYPSRTRPRQRVSPLRYKRRWQVARASSPCRRRSRQPPASRCPTEARKSIFSVKMSFLFCFFCLRESMATAAAERAACFPEHVLSIVHTHTLSLSLALSLSLPPPPDGAGSITRRISYLWHVIQCRPPPPRPACSLCSCQINSKALKAAFRLYTSSFPKLSAEFFQGRRSLDAIYSASVSRAVSRREHHQLHDLCASGLLRARNGLRVDWKSHPRLPVRPGKSARVVVRIINGSGPPRKLLDWEVLGRPLTETELSDKLNAHAQKTEPLLPTTGVYECTITYTPQQEGAQPCLFVANVAGIHVGTVIPLECSSEYTTKEREGLVPYVAAQPIAFDGAQSSMGERPAGA